MFLSIATPSRKPQITVIRGWWPRSNEDVRNKLAQEIEARNLKLRGPVQQATQVIKNSK